MMEPTLRAAGRGVQLAASIPKQGHRALCVWRCLSPIRTVTRRQGQRKHPRPATAHRGLHMSIAVLGLSPADSFNPRSWSKAQEDLYIRRAEAAMVEERELRAARVLLETQRRESPVVDRGGLSTEPVGQLDPSWLNLQLQDWIRAVLATGIDGNRFVGVEGSIGLLKRHNHSHHKSIDAWLSHIYHEQLLYSGARSVTATAAFVVAPAAVLPASVALAWATQARLAGAVAHAYGYCINCPKTRAMIMCAVLGDSLLVRKVVGDAAAETANGGTSGLVGLAQRGQVSAAELQLILQAAISNATATATARAMERIVYETFAMRVVPELAARAASKASLVLGASLTVKLDTDALKNTFECAKSMFALPELPAPPVLAALDHDAVGVRLVPQGETPWGGSAARTPQPWTVQESQPLRFSGNSPTDTLATPSALHAFDETAGMRAGAVERPALPLSEPGIFIPRLFDNIDRETIRAVFEGPLNLGRVKQIELAPTRDEGPYHKAFVSLDWACDDDEVADIRRHLLSGLDAKVTYQPPWFWVLRAARRSVLGGDGAAPCGLSRLETAKIEASIRRELAKSRYQGC